MKEAFERPIAESNNRQKRNELEFHTLKFWFLYAYCIIIIIIIITSFAHRVHAISLHFPPTIGISRG